MDKMIYVWVVVAFLGLIFEMGSPGLFYFLSFSFGALLSAITAFVTGSLIVQGIAFLIGTAVALCFLKYWLNAKFYFEGRENYKSNIFALEGKKGIVTKEIGRHKVGQVNLNGEIWIAKSVNNKKIEMGQEIKVVRVEGCRLVVGVDIEEEESDKTKGKS